MGRNKLIYLLEAYPGASAFLSLESGGKKTEINNNYYNNNNKTSIIFN